MSKLLNRARVALFNAKNCYGKVADDDAYADSCCYNLQQSIELTLKFIVEMQGKDYVENHDVRAQLNTLHKLKITIPFEKELRTMASTLNSWEAESRYSDSFVALQADIDNAFIIAEELIAFASEQVQQKSLEKMDIFQ